MLLLLLVTTLLQFNFTYMDDVPEFKKPGSTYGIPGLIIEKCEIYKTFTFADQSFKKRNCKDLANTFFKAWVGKEECKSTENDFNEYVQAMGVPIPPNKDLIFWSGAQKEAGEFSQHGRRGFNMENLPLGFMLNGISFCPTKSTTWSLQNINPGVNYTHCAAWKTCFNKVPETVTTETQVMQAFWTSASRWFATKATGHIWYFIGGHRVPAYNPESVFAVTELPTLAKYKQVTGVTVVMVNPQFENCNHGTSMLKLRAALVKQLKPKVTVRSVTCILYNDLLEKLKEAKHRQFEREKFAKDLHDSVVNHWLDIP